MPPNAPSLAEVLDGAITQRLDQVYTAMPGRVVAYDQAAQTVNALPLIRHRYVDEFGLLQQTQYPVLQNVPLVQPGGGGHAIQFPVLTGDVVLLVFSSESIDQWKISQRGVSDNFSGHHHNLNDAIAIVGLRTIQKSTRLNPPNTTVMYTPHLRIGDQNATDTMMRKSDADLFMDRLADAITQAGTALDATSVAALGWLQGALLGTLAIPRTPTWSGGIDSIVKSK